jgi:hypothetical protein
VHPLKIFTAASAIGIALGVQAASSTAVNAQPDHRHFGYRYQYREYNNPNAYPTGSSNWWQEMDRQDRGGRR